MSCVLLIPGSIPTTAQRHPEKTSIHKAVQHYVVQTRAGEIAFNAHQRMLAAVEAIYRLRAFEKIIQKKKLSKHNRVCTNRIQKLTSSTQH